MAKKKKGKRSSKKQSATTNSVSTTEAYSDTAETTIVQNERGRGAFFWWDDHIARLLRMFVAGAVGAAILNLLVWTISLGPFNVNTMVVPPGASGAEQLNPIAVLLASVIPALGAAIVYFFMDKAMGERTWRTFVIISIILALLSLIPVFMQPVSTGSKVVLSIMHIVSALGILWGIRYTLGYFPEAINRWAVATN